MFGYFSCFTLIFLQNDERTETFGMVLGEGHDGCQVVPTNSQSVECENSLLTSSMEEGAFKADDQF